jgi:hypothetical protein
MLIFRKERFGIPLTMTEAEKKRKREERFGSEKPKSVLQTSETASVTPQSKVIPCVTANVYHCHRKHLQEQRDLARFSRMVLEVETQSFLLNVNLVLQEVSLYIIITLTIFRQE